jgi:hypothetical protein
MTPLDAPPIRCFLSYARKDDVVMDFVDPFIQSLRQYAYADRGRELEIFLDRTSIGWGDLAQPVIRSAVRSATVFIPVVTRRYFDRPYCREELFVFYNQASVDDARSLLLPVVLLGDNYLAEDNPDLAVKIIVERQHRVLREAWLEGPSSPEWRRTVLALAGELVDRVEEAERSLVSVPPAADVDVSAERARFCLDIADVSDATASVTTEFMALVEAGADARRYLPGAMRLRDVGRRFERRAFEVDRLIRAAGDTLGPFVELDDGLVEGVEALLVSTHRMEAADVSMRRAMVPFREGLTALRSGLRLVESWEELTIPGQ